MATADAASDLPVGIEQIEEHIHKLCAEVLSRPVARIKLARSFVAQGGDSLLAIKLMARCQDSGYIINIQDLLQATSIREFCQHVKPEVAALPVPNIANGSESALSNGQAGRPKTKLLDERNGARADGAGLPDPADMVGVVGKGQKTEGRKAGTEEESKGCGDAESDVPPFALWKEAQLGQGGGSSSSSTLQDQLRLVADQCGISVDVIEDVYPCTPLQEGLMAVTAQQPGAYVNRWVYRMPRDLDAERFKQSWVLVARAAPLLRTRLVLGELGRALQVVVRQDIQWFSGADLDQYLAEDDACLIGYGSPLVRLAIIGSPGDEQYVVFTAHHSAYDGWSWTKLFEVATRTYLGQSTSIPASPPFTRFIRYLGDCDRALAESFWRSELGGEVGSPFPPRRDPLYRPNPTQRMVYELKVPPAPACITMAGLLRAAWALVVSSHTGDDDVVFASVLTGRTTPVRGISDMLAPVIATVPVRVRIDRTQPVADYMASVQQQAVSMMPFEHTGLQNIYRHIGARPDIAHFFGVQPAGLLTSHTTAPPLGLELHIAPSSGTDDYALSVECITELSNDAAAVQVSVRFDDTMVSRALLERLLGRFAHILVSLTHVFEKDGLVGDLSMLSPDEVTQLGKWNGQMPEKKQALVHDLVREAGLVRSERQAVCSWDGNLSHGDLDSLAERLAHHLVGLGVGPEVAVLVCFDKSKWVVVAMLAILKAGGVVVPIAAEPVQRAQAVIHDTESRVLLTTHQYASRFPGVAHNLVVDDDLLASLPNSPGPVNGRASPSNAGFIIYTSGSTGTPKGVVLEHASMSTSMQIHGKRFDMGPETRMLQFSSFTFDVSLQDIFTTLQFGGCVCIPSEEERVNDLAGAIRRLRVTFAFLTPRVLPTFNPSDVPGLQHLAVIGEALQPAHLKPWIHRLRFTNAYGPAECCIVSTSHEPVNITQASNIGHAVAVGLWVVDKSNPNRLLPIGSVGELLLEGPLLARGYLNDPEKTSAAFIKNPDWLAQHGFNDDSGPARRFYRTGDLVKQNDDGSLTYVGRRDSQVKIRGQRVEMGEVELHLNSHQSVDDAAVFVPNQGPAKSSLVALLTFKELIDPAARELQSTTPDQAQIATSLTSPVREQLLEHLPSYMVPTTWISLRFMPQNSSRKIDRPRLVKWLEAITADDLERMALVEEVDAPTVASNTQEQQLQAVLVDVLGLPVGKVVMNRSFLSLGGDSISAMQVVAQCRSRHGTTLTVRDVLQSTSIAQIASRAAAGAATGHVQDAAPHKPLKVLLEQFTTSPVLFPETSDLSSAGLTYDGLAQLWASVSEAGITSLDEVHDVHPCAPTQQGIMMSQIRDPTMYNIEHICELQVPEASGRVDINKLSQAWQAVVNRHAILRTIFVQATTGQEHLFYQVVLKKCTPQVRLIEEKGAAGTIAALSRVEQAAYVKGKPSHCLTLCATESGAVFAKLEISHALVDGVSLELVLRDVARAYKGALPGSAGPQFGSYVQFLREKRESESLAYWTHRLADAQPCYLPSSIALPPGTRSLKSVTVQIGDAINILHGFRDAQRVTIANMVQLAWGIVLARYTGSRDSIFGYVTNGRDAPIPGSNEIVGPMVNIMVSRIHLGNLPATVAHAAQKVQNDFLDAFENQRTSLGSIQHALRLPGRSLFNTVVSLFRQSSEHAPTSSADLVIRNITSEGPTEYDANLMVLAGDDTMALSLKYSGSFMDEESARLVLENTRHTLIAIASSSESKLDELETLSPSDVEKLLKWKPDLPLATGQDCLHQRIHQQRLARPDGQAVCAWDGELTYAELDAFSDRLACHLDGLGIREETIVGLCFEKSMWTIVAMLAVLKAGGVIVPLGTALPPQRLRFILENTKAAVVLTSAQCAAKFEHMEMAHKHTVDATLFTVLPDVVGPPARPSLTPDNTAFVLYTSGSTGLPKGVVLTHASLSTSLDAHGAKLGFSTSTRALQYSAYVFDLSLLELLGTLRFGGCICTVSGEDRLSPNLLAHSMTTMGVNFASTTPTVASILDPSTVPTLRTLMLGGEPLEPTTVERWSGHDVVLYNCYGPTECSIMSTINGPVTDPNLSRNVGYPVVANVWVADQDNHNHLVPIGAAGELLIEGPVVARGYLHDPEKTAAGFITDPEFASRYESAPPDGRTQRRMYRTGDLVRQSPTDGSLTYVGRRDGQVKIRGQRLEVGEIEHWAKGSFAQARMVAADLIAPAARKGAPVLALALELDIPCQGTPDGTSPLLPLTHSLRRSLSALQDALEQVLPSFMVPALYVPVQSMPLTVSGKLDRGRLRAVLNSLGEDQLSQYSLIGASGPSARALTTSESRLRDLWVSALSSAGVVGPASHFFRLGGDSVTAMRLVALAANAKPKIRLSVADVFGNPVLENMAKTVASEPGDSTAIVNGNAAAMDAAPFSLMPTSSAAQDTQLTRLSAQCGVAVGVIEDAYPCTPLQEELLALTARRQSAYVGCWVFRMGDALDADRFRSAWEKVSEAAVILRTRIIAGNDAQVGTQLVLRESLPWRMVSSDLEAYLSQNEPEPMGVGTSLMRFTVVSTPRSGRFFVWKAHHSAYDGWTLHMLLEAIRDVYSGRDAPTFAPFTRYIKYIRGANGDSEAREYWRSQLTGDVGSAFPVIPPNHQPRPSSTVSLRVTPSVTPSVTPAATSSNFTTATLLRAAWALVLSQETGSRDVLFAANLSGRMAPVPGILDMAAPTLAAVPVHINTDRNRSVADYLSAVQQQAAEMIPFEHAGMQNINQMLPEKTLDLNHLFVIQPFADRLGEDSASLLPQGLEWVPYGGAAPFHAYPLVVECNTGAEAENKGDGVELEAWFDEAVLPSDKAREIMERFKHIFIQLRAAASSSGVDSSTPVARIDILGPQDIPRIRGWNQWVQPTDPSSDACIHDLVHQQRLRQPDAQAVCAWDGQLTYAELDHLSLELAHHLVSLGVQSEVPVLMIFEKTLWAVVAQLAILRAGGIIVPVGHNYPVQRVQHIIQATGANVILASKMYEAHRGLVPHVLVLDENLMARLPLRQPALACGTAKPTDAAFTLFTSGSTGTPKGVVLEHRSLVASLKAQRGLFAGPAARVLQFSAYSFDISIAETFVPLIMGGCVCVPSEDDRVGDLAGAMEAMKVNLAHLTPTMGGLVQPRRLLSLRTVVFVGEALTSEAASRWLVGHIRVFNGYGPTECSMYSSARHIKAAGEAPNIGTAIAGSNLWVVEPFDHNCLVPVGVPGELLIEGPLLARGYLGDEKKTTAAFVTDPTWVQYFDLGPRKGRRFYRTGDLVRQAPDGTLEYLGRRDTQVKLHGQRIEIGEIEHWVQKVLGARAGATVAGLLTRDNGSGAAGEPALAVAVEMDHAEPRARQTPERTGGQPFTLLPLSDDQRQLFGRVRASLSEVLPSYMVPRLYIPVDKLPMTDSGKVDRRAVWTTIQQSRLSSQYSVITNRTRVAPDTDTGRQLQQLWAAALRIPPQEIWAGDDFFLSGGDSMSAMRMVAKAREATRMPLTVADIFQYPILADLAKVVETRGSETAPSQSVYQAFSAMGVAEPGPYVAESIQPLLLEGCHAVDAAPVTDSQSLFVVSSLRKTRDSFAYITLTGEGSCDVEKWKARCWELVKRHEILRTAYIFVNEQMLQVVLQEWRPDIAHFETNDAAIDGFTKELFARDMNRPPSLGRPFVEFAIVTSPSQHRILFRLSHADYDALTMFHLLDDLSAIHDGKESPAEPSSFIRDYVSALQGSPETQQKSRSYWRNLLQGAAMPRIAPPHQHGPSKVIHHSTRTVSLPDRDSQSGNRITAGTLMRAAWGLTLARYTGMADVTFGETVSGRSTGQPAAATAVGCCANIVPARIVIRANASVRDLLDAAQAQHVARLPHETVGFRELLGNSGKVEAEDPHFTTRINHRDRPPRGTLQRIGDTTYQTAFSLSEDAEDLPDMSLTSHPYPDHIEVIFHYREGAISAEAAEHFMSCLCAVSELLAATSSQSMRLGEIELGPHAVGWPVVGNGSVALGIGQSEEGDCGVSD